MLAWDELAQLDGLGGSIRARRIELGWTQSELAERSGVPQADISRIENDRLDARWSTVQRLLTALAEGAEPAGASPTGDGCGHPDAVQEVDAEQAGGAHPTLLDVILATPLRATTPHWPRSTRDPTHRGSTKSPRSSVASSRGATTRLSTPSIVGSSLRRTVARSSPWPPTSESSTNGPGARWASVPDGRGRPPGFVSEPDSPASSPRR
ncbi:MAG: helix-turn-helix domain-containing protein [Microthrixaceae bacterium]|nr:helix-turn-helix domain-containing protein [Microthrixaceae bacterium]